MALDIGKIEWAPWGLCAATLGASWVLHPPGLWQAAGGVVVAALLSWAGTRVLRKAAKPAADALAALERQCQQHRTVIDSLPFQVWLKDPQGTHLLVNQAYAQRLHLPQPDAAVGKTDFALWPLPLAQRFRDDDAQVMASGKPLRVEEQQGTAPDARWFDIVKTPVHYGPGQGGTVGVAIDISERKALEKRLTDSEQQFRGLAENITDLILCLDKQGQRVYMNPAMQRLYRRILGEHVDVMDSEVTLLNSHYRRQHEALVAQVLTTGREGLLELASPARGPVPQIFPPRATCPSAMPRARSRGSSSSRATPRCASRPRPTCKA